jgi:hypothetical protein
MKGMNVALATALAFGFAFGMGTSMEAQATPTGNCSGNTCTGTTTHCVQSTCSVYRETFQYDPVFGWALVSTVFLYQYNKYGSETREEP